LPVTGKPEVKCHSIATHSRLRIAANLLANQHATVSDYREFPVPAQLANHFLCLWTQLIVGSGEYSHPVLPDSCIDIVFINDELPIVVGPWTDPFITKFFAGARITGVRLRPGYAPSVLGVPASELLNHSVPLTVLWGRRGTEPFARIWKEPALTARRLALSEVLSSCFAFAAPPDETVIRSMRWLARHPYGRIKQLSRLTGISERQIHRRFSAAVGFGPKMFQSVLRFQRFLRLVGERHSDWQTLSDKATFVGYADQPHMTREIRRFAGCPPTALPNHAKCTLQFSDLQAIEPLFT
jgi:AraC-like DNA-binding protein